MTYLCAFVRGLGSLRDRPQCCPPALLRPPGTLPDPDSAASMQTSKEFARQTTWAVMVVDRLIDRLMAHRLSDLGINALGQFDSDGHWRVLSFETTPHMSLQIRTPIKQRNLGPLSHRDRAALCTPRPILLTTSVAMNLGTDRASMTTQISSDLNNGAPLSDPKTDLLSFAQ